jgi:hypothetical protein
LLTAHLAGAESESEDGLSVRVSVVATDTSGGVLHYRWKSTDGSIQDVNAPNTVWTLPSGPGLHFAYVLVSNGLGGYTERRIVVDTDGWGGGESGGGRTSVTLSPPPAPAQIGDYFRSFVSWGFASGDNGANSMAPDVLVRIQDPVTNVFYPSANGVATDIKGQFIVGGLPVPPGTNTYNPYYYNMSCSIAGPANFGDCDGGTAFMVGTATPQYFPSSPAYAASTAVVSGSFRLADGTPNGTPNGTPCGIQDEFFGVHVNATATLRDAHNAPLAMARVDEYGDYALPAVPGGTFVSLQCEDAPVVFSPPFTEAVYPDTTTVVPLQTLAGVTPPTITSMSATRHGKPVGTFLPPPTGFASDSLKRADGYLAFKGVDSKRSACQYYKAVGAVQGCDSQGNFTGAKLTFDAWQRAEKIGPYVKHGAKQYTAAYVNRADLNLTRQHTSVSYGPADTVAVVCNHLGPPANTPAQLLNPLQSDIDTAVANAVNGKNLVACVAMDYTATPGVNNGQPFVRFLIFGPDGTLLPSVNLDGRAEKYVPGTCVVCHGGDHYQGRFPEDGSGFANIGGHFLPYDTGNFEFSTKHGFTEPDQEESIYNLNQNVLKAGPTQAEIELIDGWYASGHTLDKNYLPASWQGLGSVASDFYTHVIARSCRGCHVAQIEGYNYDHEYNVDELNYLSPFFGDPDFEFNRSVCGGGHEDAWREFAMPNSLVTFNRFWASAGTSEDQVAYANAYLAYPCGTVPSPL